VFDALLELFPDRVAEFHLVGKSRPILRLANGLAVSVIVCERKPRKTGIMRWMFRPVSAEAQFVALICLDAPDQTRFFVVPRINIERNCFIGTSSQLFKTGIRLNDLAEFYDVASAFLNSSGQQQQSGSNLTVCH
jgi:hypothetical protein